MALDHFLATERLKLSHKLLMVHPKSSHEFLTVAVFDAESEPHQDAYAHVQQDEEHRHGRSL
jgi:hypothetical protein